MATIEAIGAREILDSRGNPTVEVEVELDDGTIARAAVPSGASTGAFEAVELRDGDKPATWARACRSRRRRPGRDRPRARRLRRQRAAPGRPDDDRPRRHPQQGRAGRQRDPRRLAGRGQGRGRARPSLPLFRYLGGPNAHVLPVPMMNILNGGAHADTNVDIQEFMVAPIGAPRSARRCGWGAEIYHALKSVLKTKGLSTGPRRRGRLRPQPAAATARPST